MRHLLPSFFLALSMVACSRSPVIEQARTLGQREFTQQSWTLGTQVERGEMLASLLIKHPASGLTAEQVKQLLGTPTGYADYDEDPAYMVGPATVQSEYGKGHLLIFVTDKKTGRVLETRLVPEVRK